MAADDLAVRVARHVVRDALFPEPGRVLVAVSGGADSVALLLLLREIGPPLGLELVVVHVDHGISPASGSWATLVGELAARASVPCRTVPLGLGPGASETLARRARYRVLRRVQRETGARYLATAHHADDQVETVLFRLLRGSGPAGLAGIAPTAPGGLVRPLLPFRKAELVSWLSSRAPDITVAADPANESPRHDRSWVRASLLPRVRARFPDVDERIMAAATQARAERDAWRAVLTHLPELEFRPLDRGIEVARASFARYDQRLSAAVLRAAAREVGCRLGNRRLARLATFAREGASGRSMQLGGGWTAELAFDRLRLSRSGHPLEAEEALGAGDHGACRWGAWRISWRREPAGTAGRADAVTWITPGTGSVRAWRPGDRLLPLGGVGRRKVRRLLMEARVPRSERSAYPLVVRDDDILWIPGICRSQTGLPRPGEPALRLDARRTGHSETHGWSGD